MSRVCVVIGAGQTAAQMAVSLRQGGWQGHILVVGDEACLPYHRPPLSKSYMQQDKGENDFMIRPLGFYDKHGIEFKLGCSVEAIDRKNKSVILECGETIFYDKLALCTGSRVRTLAIPGAELEGIHYLKNIADARRIKAGIEHCKKAIIVGGGYVGLEIAAVLNKLGMAVTVLEFSSRILARVTAPEVSEFYARVHAEEGVTVKNSMDVVAFEGEGCVERVVCVDGSVFFADLVVVGVGVTPNVELAARAGLAVDNGIVVDKYMCTTDPDIVSAGDCTSHTNQLYGRRVRLESVPNAVSQAKAAAATLCGNPSEAAELPWFWSDQYNLKLQIAGLNQGYDQVVIRGNKDTERSFVSFYLKEGKLIAADCINRPMEFLISKRLIAEQVTVDHTLLADDSVPIKSLLSS